MAGDLRIESKRGEAYTAVDIDGDRLGSPLLSDEYSESDALSVFKQLAKKEMRGQFDPDDMQLEQGVWVRIISDIRGPLISWQGPFDSVEEGVEHLAAQGYDDQYPGAFETIEGERTQPGLPLALDGVGASDDDDLDLTYGDPKSTRRSSNDDESDDEDRYLPAGSFVCIRAHTARSTQGGLSYPASAKARTLEDTSLGGQDVVDVEDIDENGDVVGDSYSVYSFSLSRWPCESGPCNLDRARFDKLRGEYQDVDVDEDSDACFDQGTYRQGMGVSKDTPWWRSNFVTGSDYQGGSVYRSNYLVLKEMCEKLCEDPDVCKKIWWVDLTGGHGTYSIALHVERTPNEIIEVLERLEDYPLIDEDAHSQLEIELETEAWQNWGESEFKREIEKAFKAATGCDVDWGEVDGPMIFEYFEVFRENANEYWEDGDGGRYIDIEAVVKKGGDWDPLRVDLPEGATLVDCDDEEDDDDWVRDGEEPHTVVVREADGTMHAATLHRGDLTPDVWGQRAIDLADRLGLDGPIEYGVSRESDPGAARLLPPEYPHIRWLASFDREAGGGSAPPGTMKLDLDGVGASVAQTFAYDVFDDQGPEIIESGGGLPLALDGVRSRKQSRGRVLAHLRRAQKKKRKRARRS